MFEWLYDHGLLDLFMRLLWPGMGLAVGIVIGLMFRKFGGYKSFAVGTSIGVVIAMLLVGAFYAYQALYAPYYMGIYMDWPSVYLKSMMQYGTYYGVVLFTSWFVSTIGVSED